MSQKIDAVTLFRREPGDAPEKSMKHGRHDDRLYLDADNRLKTERAEIVELPAPVVSESLTGIGNYPRRVQEFFGVGVEGER